ncbi:MAG: hypothetical protein WBE23_14500, partial [Candidatus Sulfotelmatobacter sp.]
MNKRWVGLLLMVATATALCLAQEDSKVSSQLPASAAGPETKAVLSENTANTSVGPTFQQRYTRYKLEYGDQFDVSFELSPEFNQTVTVQPWDKYVLLRMLLNRENPDLAIVFCRTKRGAEKLAKK